MPRNTYTCYWLVSIGACAALASCNQRTVVRQRTPPGSEPNEVTISSPGTAATKEKEKKEVVVTAPPATREIVTVQPAPPPPPPTEVRTTSPAVDYVWVPGAYEWTNGRWEWTAGHWVRPAQPTATWEPGHWESVPGGWQWQPGRWR